jgi:hypothetical protein
LWRPERDVVADLGFSTSPDDCYLVLRGMRTLGVRMRHQMQSALAVARWLQAQPDVLRVLHPGLPDDPGHALWMRDFTGSSALFGVELAARSLSINGMHSSDLLGGRVRSRRPANPISQRKPIEISLRNVFKKNGLRRLSLSFG